MAALMRFRLFRLGGTACLLCLSIWTMPVQAVEVPPPAYGLAAHEAAIPPAVLFAVALQESGVRLRGQRIPWPWTLNVAGQPRRFQSRAAACASLRAALEEVSPTRIDVGLGQINVGYQAHRFDHPCALLDPFRNLAIAATILREYHAPGEDWLLAVGRYHRPAGGAAAARYRLSVRRYLSETSDEPVSITTSRSLAP